MNNRLQQFLYAENISQSQLADTLGVARASISHIISGRNKPGFDFIENMMKQFPTLSIEWLISGKGKMYKYQNLSPAEIEPKSVAETIVEVEPETVPEAALEPENEPETIPQVASESIPEPVQSDAVPKTPQKGRRIEKIVIFYDDSTFQEIKG